MTSQQPNILVIMPDQMRGDCLGLDGHPAVLTPNLDQIGAQGAFFRRAYTTCASCIPARRSLLTGQFPCHNGMVGFVSGCPLSAPTLPQQLRQSGYQTALVGRNMHQYPANYGYGYNTIIGGSTYIQDDAYARMLEQAAPGSGGIRGHGISHNGWAARPWQLPDYLHPTNWVVQRSLDVLAEQGPDQPLFLTTSFYAPHPPLIPPAFYMERYLRMELPAPALGGWASAPADGGRAGGVDSHHTWLRGEALRSAQAGYYGLINHIDDQLYWLLAKFRGVSAAAGRPWIVAVVSDHGEMLGDHYYFRKCEPYEGSSRIPFLLNASRELGFCSGLVCEQPVCLEDLMPTLLEAAGAELPAGVDGVSLVPILRGGQTELRPWLHGEHARCYDADQAYHFLTDGCLKYIWRPSNGSEQLFDLRSDPGERDDLAVVPAQRQLLELWRQRLIEQLAERPEGFVADNALVAGRDYPGLLPQAPR